MEVIYKHKISMNTNFNIKENKDFDYTLIANSTYSFEYEGLKYDIDNTKTIYSNVTMSEIEKALEEGKIDLILQNNGYALVKEKINSPSFKREHLLNKINNRNFNYTYIADEETQTMTVISEED